MSIGSYTSLIPPSFNGKNLAISEAQGDYGSFKDSTKAPVHRWFMYPAGYSYRLVEAKIAEYNLSNESYVLDPFLGCGTTSVAAKMKGVNSIGIEAHPFVHWVAKTKLFWEYALTELKEAIAEVYQNARYADTDSLSARIEDGEFPELVIKCFTPQNLLSLLVLRESIAHLHARSEITDFLNLALTSALRVASWAGTGWPYIAPTKYHGKTVERDALEAFQDQVNRMYQDLVYLRTIGYSHNTTHVLTLGDARKPFPEIGPETIDLVITSPPYLNNYDYADRTRLELYFFGWASSWRDITEQVRDKLIMAATTQVTRSNRDPVEFLSRSIEEAEPRVYSELVDAIRKLSKMRLTKGGKKNYDIMVAGYFTDIFKVLCQVYTVLKPGSDFILVLGDSAPYGVYIPTDIVIGRLAASIGFMGFQIELLRSRGGKWPSNSQRHKVDLRESLVTITK